MGPGNVLRSYIAHVRTLSSVRACRSNRRTRARCADPAQELMTPQTSGIYLKISQETCLPQLCNVLHLDSLEEASKPRQLLSYTHTVRRIEAVR